MDYEVAIEIIFENNINIKTHQENTELKNNKSKIIINGEGQSYLYSYCIHSYSN